MTQHIHVVPLAALYTFLTHRLRFMLYASTWDEALGDIF